MNTKACPISINSANTSVTDLVLLSQQRNEAAFTELLRRHNAFIKARLYKLAPDWSEHSDLIQEIHIRIWRFIPSLKQPAAFRRWLSQLITNVFFGELRKIPRNIHVMSLDEPITNDSSDETTREIKDDSMQPEDVLLAKELTAVISEAIEKVPAHFKTPQLLRDVEGMSYQEIAQLTHTELGTVKSRIARARLRIQASVTEYLNCA